MLDLKNTIVAKSDQLNADDLIGISKTITITKVAISNSPDQPLIINYEDDNGKPYKPCKGMRRVLVKAWGDDGDLFVGRALTLYNNPDVKWAGKEVGGIQISHMSDIRGEITMALTVSRGKKIPYKVKQLVSQQKKITDGEKKYFLSAIDSCKTLADLQSVADEIKENNYDDDSRNMLMAIYKEASAKLRGE
jgi:hypothetical protein